VDASRPTVLVVDDDAAIRLLCRVNLELDGWTVREADTVALAREALALGDVRAALVDVHVGDESGLAFLEELRRDHPDVGVALLTGTIDAPTLDGATPDALIPKPFELDELLETVRTIAG